VELLVDPRTLGGLMASGGGLLVLGLVAWLWSKGVFDNPLVVAIALGAANLGVLAAGIVTVRFTRHQMAGRALTMLACLVMPLNLWFYDAQGLVTIAEGGHLWVPAVFCCLVYVLVARLLADPLFVHAIVAGVTMTGMLLLADSRVGRFWEVIAPSTFLVVLGMVCIHVERAFAPGDGPFSRDRFGRAFFRAGHVVMALGLAVLVVARISGWLYEPWLADLDWFAMPAVATETNLKLLALALVLGAAYSYVYSQVVVQARGRYVASAVLATLWSGVILLDLLAVPFTMEVVAVLVAGAALAANAAAQFAKQRETSADSAEPGTSFFGPLGNTGWTFAAGLNVVGLVLGAVMLFLSHTEPLWPGQDYELSWVYVVAMTITAASWGWTAFLARQSTSMTVEAWNRFGLVATAWFASRRSRASACR
jgi:hypothetical protein